MKIRHVIRFTIPLVLLLILLPPLAAQDFRGALGGTVKDDTGAVLPGVTVTVTNTGTNIASTTVTNERGYYQVRYLISGVYSVSASLEGFRTAVRSGVEVRVGDALNVDLALKLGQTSETLTVTASTPYLDTTATATGQVIDRQQIKELPLADGTAYMLTRLAPGVSETSDLHFSRPMDNGNLAGFTTNGAKGGNDFTIDGAPNMVSPENPGVKGERIGFSPPSDAIAEFRINTTDFDAGQGHTAGANVNLALRSGANDIHGAASFFNRSSNRTKKSIFAERAGDSVVSRKYDRGTAMASGPIYKDKTFFMVAYEGLKDLTAEPAYYTVPTAKMRTGDLSEYLPLNIKIYDPLTGTTNRTWFTGNIIPTARLNPIAMKLLSYYPLPNIAGRSDMTNNYYSPMNRTYDYKAVMMRLDHNFTSNQKLAFTGYWNTRTEDRYNWAGVVNDFAVTKGYDLRSNVGFTGTYTNLISPELIGDFRLSYSKFGKAYDRAEPFDPATLGFNAATVALFRGYQYLPRFDIAGFATMGAQRSTYAEGRNEPFYNVSAAPTMTRVFTNHTIRAGYDYRHQRYDWTDNGYRAGRYNFTGDYTRQNRSVAIQTGQSLAQFLLGIPTSGGNSSIDTKTPTIHTQDYHALYGQDTWAVNSRLTVNMGLRVEVDRGLREKYARNINGFDLTATNPLNDAARSNYAKNPISEISADQFRVLGGIVYTGNPIYSTLTSILPRLGVSYQLNPQTVLRGGAGLFAVPYFFDARNDTGFSQSTLLVSTENNGGTFIADLNNPFPNGIATPPGSSQGLLTSVGRDLVGSNQAVIINEKRKSPEYLRWQLGAQRDIGGGWMAQFDYVGSKGRNLTVRHDLNSLGAQYVSYKRERDTAQESYLTANVANPFAGMLPGTTINGSTIQRQQLLKAYPEFLRVAIQEYNGSDSYNSGQLTVSKRFHNGLSLIASYAQSKLLEKVGYLNGFDTQLEKRTSPDDRPKRATVGLTLPFPFGENRQWGSNWGPATNAILGGWSLSASYQYQKGGPLSGGTTGGIDNGWPHLYFDPSCNWNSLKVGSVGSKNSSGKVIGLDVPAWNTSCFYFHDAAVQTNGVDDPAKQRSDPRIAIGTANARYFPTILGNMRMPNLHLIDMGLSKNFKLSRGLLLQVRADFINAINYTVYWDPDMNPRSATFGTFRSQRNNPRDIQLGGRLTF